MSSDRSAPDTARTQRSRRPISPQPQRCLSFRRTSASPSRATLSPVHQGPPLWTTKVLGLLWTSRKGTPVRVCGLTEDGWRSELPEKGPTRTPQRSGWRPAHVPALTRSCGRPRCSGPAAGSGSPRREGAARSPVDLRHVSCFGVLPIPPLPPRSSRNRLCGILLRPGAGRRESACSRSGQAAGGPDMQTACCTVTERLGVCSPAGEGVMARGSGCGLVEPEVGQDEGRGHRRGRGGHAVSVFRGRKGRCPEVAGDQVLLVPTRARR